MRDVQSDIGHANAIFDQLGCVGENLARYVCAGAAAEEFCVDTRLSSGEVGRMVIVELGETDARSGGELIRQARVNPKKQVFGAAVKPIAVGSKPTRQPLSINDQVSTISSPMTDGQP